MFSSLAEVLNCETDMIELLKLYLFKVLTKIEVLYCLYLVLMSKMFSLMEKLVANWTIFYW